MFFVMMRFAFLPVVILPYCSEISIAYAPFRVAALMASSGLIFILIQARLTIKFMLPLGAEPGLKSDAMASAVPPSISALAGV